LPGKLHDDGIADSAGADNEHSRDTDAVVALYPCPNTQSKTIANQPEQTQNIRIGEGQSRQIQLDHIEQTG
jgi:hypothetical protein